MALQFYIQLRGKKENRSVSSSGYPTPHSFIPYAEWKNGVFTDHATFNRRTSDYFLSNQWNLHDHMRSDRTV